VNPAARVLDETRLLKDAEGERDGRAVYAEHVGERFVREPNLIACDTVMSHQQPARTTGFERVEPVAGDHLRHLIEKGECVS